MAGTGTVVHVYLEVVMAVPLRKHAGDLRLEVSGGVTWLVWLMRGLIEGAHNGQEADRDGGEHVHLR